MNEMQLQTVRETAASSLSGGVTFPEVLQRLSSVGVERYHADYSRGETTYYHRDGGSLVVPMPSHGLPAFDFSAAGVESAVRQSQRGEHTYSEFVVKTLAAGCVGYFVYLAGRHVCYLGRLGECHVEPFPHNPDQALQGPSCGPCK